MQRPDYGARARLRQWQAGRAWMITNRHDVPLHAVERLAESSDTGRLREAALETGNWPLVRCLDAIAAESSRARKRP